MRELKLAVENLESMIQSGCPHETETHREYANCRVFYCVDCGQELRTDMKI